VIPFNLIFIKDKPQNKESDLGSSLATENNQHCNVGSYTERKLNHLIKDLVLIYPQNCRVKIDLLRPI